MDDLDEVRAHLGYDKINIYGGSYGTRAALVYLRQHEPHVRAVVLDGVAPPDMRLPLFFARDAQRALDKLLAGLRGGRRLRYAVSGSGGSHARACCERLDKRTGDASRLTHPRTGVADEVTVNAAFVSNVVFGALYSPMTSSLVPELAEARRGRRFPGVAGAGDGQRRRRRQHERSACSCR